MAAGELESKLLGTPPDQPAYVPYPEVARAIRAQTSRILDEWRGRTLFSMPELGDLSVQEFKDNLGAILAAMADALESNERPDLKRLVHAAPEHGFQRFMHKYDLADLFAEERVLRRVIVSAVEDEMQRRCTREESASLHAMIDIMLQQGVLAFVQEQKQELRRANEVQLTYLSFLSHDLGNNFQAVTTGLDQIKDRINTKPEEAAGLVDAAQATMRRTWEGMQRLLEHERLRHQDSRPAIGLVVIRDVVEPIVTVAADAACDVEVDIEEGATAFTNAGLLTIILQNLIGNACKHSGRGGDGRGAVRVEATRHHGGEDLWRISVSDDGPGIPADQIERIFNAFERVPSQSAGDERHGYGLGLAIAAQAARLLGTTIDVQSSVGHGARFSFQVPASRVGHEES